MRCGEPLESRDSPYPHETRGFAAAPHQHVNSPRIVSTLFPHLPRAEMIAFESTLLGGTAAIVVLSVLRLFPLALIAAAALVPFLVVLYLWSVKLYEDEPLPMLLFTIVWGALAGVGLGLAARHVNTTLDLLTERTAGHTVLWIGVLLPLLTVAVTIAGPLVLIGYRRFDGVLDGATFGSACAVSCLGAEAITNSASFLGGGLRAAGTTSLWVARLLTLGVAVPVVGAGAVGAACAAFWLRYRAPLRDRGALGVLGSPAVAVAVAAAALVGVNLSAIYLGQWSTLAISAAAAAVALVSLRRAVHLGLREEALDTPIGPPVRCPNCHRETPLHHFCARCGVALRALPKAGPAGAVPRPAPSRIHRHVIPVVFAAVLTAAVGAAVLAIVEARPAPVQPACTPGVPCGLPPIQSPLIPVSHLQAAAAPFRAGTQWTSSAGVGLRYDAQLWRPFRRSSDQLFLEAENSHTGLFVIAGTVVVPASTGAAELLSRQVEAEQGDGLLGMTLDTNRAHTLLGAQIGVVPAIGAMYTATLDSPPSPSVRVEIAFEAATFGGATTLIEAVTDEQAANGPSKASSPFPAFALVDQILETLSWPSQV